uniref:Uncharacterized protein n=1 Tax=Arundo donax TaxID=35708 RepID=A0A0A9EA60_ARUDO
MFMGFWTSLPSSLNYDLPIIGTFPHDQLYHLSTVISCCFNIFLILRLGLCNFYIINASIILPHYRFTSMSCI